MRLESRGLRFAQDVYGRRDATRWKPRERFFPTNRISRSEYLEGQLIRLLNAYVSLEEKTIVDQNCYTCEDYDLFRKALDNGLVLTFRGIQKTNKREFIKRCSQHFSAAAESIREMKERASK